jgi:hypothetical protein
METNGGFDMEERYVTIVGIDHYFGKKPYSVGDLVLLAKEPDNEVDGEAVRVLVPRLGTVGYVANSPNTVARGTQSAGRIHDAMGEACFARVMFITRGEVIARLEPGIVEELEVTRIMKKEEVVFAPPSEGPLPPEAFRSRKRNPKGSAPKE